MEDNQEKIGTSLKELVSKWEMTKNRVKFRNHTASGESTLKWFFSLTFYYSYFKGLIGYHIKLEI